MVFKDRLKEKRVEAGLTQAELAKRAGVTARTIQNYELGNRKPANMEVIQKIADALGTMGRMFEAHDEITNAMLKQKLFDEWGERGTLEATSRRVTLTLKELGLIKDASRTRYILTKQEITNTEVINFVIATISQAVLLQESGLLFWHLHRKAQSNRSVQSKPSRRDASV